MNRRTLLIFAVTCLLVGAPAIAQETTDTSKAETPMVNLKIKLASIMVDDQAKAEEFYTAKLGLEVKHKMPVGEYYWLTFVSPNDTAGMELSLEPNVNPAAATYQKALKEQGIPAFMFFVEDVAATVEALKERGVTITMEPTDMDSTVVAVFDDTCGNLIMIAQETE